MNKWEEVGKIIDWKYLYNLGFKWKFIRKKKKDSFEKERVENRIWKFCFIVFMVDVIRFEIAGVFFKRGIDRLVCCLVNI